MEVIVLTHIGHSQEARAVRSLEDFSSALDFLQPPEDQEVADESEEPGASTNRPGEPPLVGTDDAVVGEEPVPVAEEDPWNVVTQVEQMGPEMQEAWRRLRLSAPFRPLQYLAWEQGSNAPFPVMRVHDLEAVLIEDPWAEQRLLLAAEETTEFGDTVTAPGDAAPGDEEAAALPDPIAYYRLDGTVSLTRSRFLHLGLAIEWREPVFDEDLAHTPIPLAPAPGEPPAQASPASFRVYRLEQSRPVRTGRMEYFDGPVLGVLAWVSNISDTVVTEPTE